MEYAAKTLLTQLQNEDYAMAEGASENRERGLKNLLLSALAVCRPTEEDIATFVASGMWKSFAKIVKQDPRMRNSALELLKNFGPREHYSCTTAKRLAG